MCVTNFTCILLENQGHSAVRVSVSSKSVFKNYLSAVHFLLRFWQFWDLFGYMKSFKTDIQKSPGQSLKKTSVTIIIKALITAYDSTVQDLAAKIQ